MNILDEVRLSYESLSLAEKEARNVALACTLEPISNKPGCVTRYIDLNRNTLEMFISAGVNVYPAFYHLAEFLQQSQNQEGMYKFFHEAILLSKANRKGGQINQGILEFLFPIVAAHVLYDPNNEKGTDYLLEQSSLILKRTNTDDVREFVAGKFAGRDITKASRGKGYEIFIHDVDNVSDFYLKEYQREMNEKGHATGLMHNRQFVEGFPDIKLCYDAFCKSNKKFSDRLVDAYIAVMTKKENLGIGVGLVADFTAVTIYLALSYLNDQELIE